MSPLVTVKLKRQQISLTAQDSPAESVIKKKKKNTKQTHTHTTFSSLISKTAPKTNLTHARAGTYLKVVIL